MTPLGKGVSARYLGQSGAEYFAYQDREGMAQGRINARKFAASVRPADRVLDFGCGSGGLLAHLSCVSKWGVEVNPLAAAACRDRGILVVDSLRDVPALAVDVVVSNHVLEHVLDPLAVLKQLRTKLVAGGRLLLCVPMDDWRTQRRYTPEDINHHLFAWTPLGLGHLLSEAGFQVSSVRIYTHAWPRGVFLWDRLLPVWAFDAICRFWSVLRRRRQILAVAINLAQAPDPYGEVE